MNYGEKITELRKSKGMTQTELGIKLNVAFQTISKWERGESVPDLDMMFKISKLFGVPITYFDNSESEEEIAAAEAETVDFAPAKKEPAMLGVCTECGRVVYEGGAAVTSPALVCKECRARKVAIKQKERTDEAKSAKKRLLAGLITAGILGVWWLIGAIIVAVEGEPAVEIGMSFAGTIFILTFVPQLFWKESITRSLCGLGVSLFADHIILLILFFGLFILFTIFGFVIALIIAPISFVPELLNLIFTIKNGKPKKKPKAKTKKK